MLMLDAGLFLRQVENGPYIRRVLIGEMDMNTRLCNATLRITTDHYGNTKPEIVLSYVTQDGREIRRKKTILEIKESTPPIDLTMNGTAEVSTRQMAEVYGFLHMVAENFK